MRRRMFCVVPLIEQALYQVLCVLSSVSPLCYRHLCAASCVVLFGLQCRTATFAAGADSSSLTIVSAMHGSLLASSTDALFTTLVIICKTPIC